MGTLKILPCLDLEDIASEVKRSLDINRGVAAELGQTAVEAARLGYYFTRDNTKVSWGNMVQHAVSAKKSIPPQAELPNPASIEFPVTEVQVTNETTLRAGFRLYKRGLAPLALNFANGIHPGGGFLSGAKAQEENLCRSSALYMTLTGDPMYEAHMKRPRPDSTDWAILSPDVPIFRTDDGTALDEPWIMSFITCAAPYVPGVGQPESGDLLQRRIHRVLAIARAYGYQDLILGAWGCGAFGNDPWRTAQDFRTALEGAFSGAFHHVVFAVTDWSPERKFLQPFRETFTEGK